MYGTPKDIEGECNAHLYLADDWGDNTCTVRCNLEAGHQDQHQEKFRRDGHLVIITWSVDERDKTGV